MRNHRGILTVLVSAALLGAAVITAALWYYPWLPDPARANRRELIRWLVTRNLEYSPTATCEALARRLEEEFSGEIDWNATASVLTDRQRQRLCENVGLLVGPWMRDKARCYAALPVGERVNYLDRLIDTLQRWRGLDELGTGDASESGLLVTAQRQLDAMQEETGTGGQRQVNEFVQALRARWALRELSRRFESAVGAWLPAP